MTERDKPKVTTLRPFTAYELKPIHEDPEFIKLSPQEQVEYLMKQK